MTQPSIPPPPPIPKVYACIAAVSADLAKQGVGKTRANVQQGYKFRGIDEMYNAIAPVISQRGLVIVPRILSRTLTERATQKGNALFYVVVEAEFDFVCAEDATQVTVRMYGEAMDSADKATNKAMSAAYKYAVMQTFCIPTEGDNDADASHHEVQAANGKAEAPALRNELPASRPPEPDGYRAWVTMLEGVAEEGTTALQEAWSRSSIVHRDYLTKHYKAVWTAFKDHAATVKASA